MKQRVLGYNNVKTTCPVRYTRRAKHPATAFSHKGTEAPRGLHGNQ